jgi:uncharacterized SAM-binding protein YcdF (DUF218 family)
MLDVIICLGKAVHNDGSIDWILQERVKKAAEIASNNPQAMLILSGAKHHLDNRSGLPSEAEAMLKYIKDNNLLDSSRIIIEDKGSSTIHQQCIIKTDFLIPNNYKNIGLVTDELHMPRAEVTLKSILGPGFGVVAFPSIVNLAGKARALIIDDEKKSFDLTMETRVNVISPGDHSK